jgi:adenylate cyclase
MPTAGAPGSRRLATIMFADVDGYSRMMRADEERTLLDLRAHLAEFVAPVVQRFNGRIVKTVGDGVLVEFGSAVEAVRSAAELQRGMVERNATLPENRRQFFRIGLHLGDIIVSEGDVFGDTVNLAARLQGLADPGAVLMSREVYEQVRDRLAGPFRELGRRALKNIDRPVHIYAIEAEAVAAPSRKRWMTALAAVLGLVVVAGAAVALYSGRDVLTVQPEVATVRPNTDSGLSVAVLLFTNQSGDAGQDYFADGLSEDIAHALGRFSQLTVIAHGAVLPLRGKQLPPAEFGQILNARYLVSGSVRRMGQRIRITAQLTDAVNGTQLWADQYDDLMTDIFQVQERIARRVAGTLAANLNQIALQQSLRKPPENLDAYDLLLRGRALANETTRAGNRQARELLERATQVAPNYADAYAELADAHFQRATFGWSEFVHDDIDAAIRLAQRAIELDPDCTLAHGVLARAYTARQKYELGLAESERALRLNPSDADVLAARAAVLLWTGQIANAIAAAEMAYRLNANLGPEAALNLGLAYLLSRRYSDAIRLLEAARARYPGHPLLDFPLAGAYAEAGRAADAYNALETGRRKNPHLELAAFGSRFQDPGLKRRIEDSLRKAGMK